MRNRRSCERVRVWVCACESEHHIEQLITYHAEAAHPLHHTGAHVRGPIAHAVQLALALPALVKRRGFCHFRQGAYG